MHLHNSYTVTLGILHPATRHQETLSNTAEKGTGVFDFWGMFRRRIYIHRRLTKQKLGGYMTAVYKYSKERSTALGKVVLIINIGEAMQTLDKYLDTEFF